MILHSPARVAPYKGELTPAWEAIAHTQRAHSTQCVLVRQPDHARLSGELAESFVIPGKPAITDEIVRGISLHDEGWAEFDCGAEKLRSTPARYSDEGIALNAEGVPLSFQDIKPGDFLRAWRDSIHAAEAVAPIAGLIVSGHFYRLASSGISVGRYSQADKELVRQFLREEENRRERLEKPARLPSAEIEYWTDVLQFCDLLSLYLCCGAQASVVFPQRIAADGVTLELRVEGGLNVFAQSLFLDETEFTVQALTFPGLQSITLKWTLR